MAKMATRSEKLYARLAEAHKALKDGTTDGAKSEARASQIIATALKVHNSTVSEYVKHLRALGLYRPCTPRGYELLEQGSESEILTIENVGRLLEPERETPADTPIETGSVSNDKSVQPIAVFRFDGTQERPTQIFQVLEALRHLQAMGIMKGDILYGKDWIGLIEAVATLMGIRPDDKHALVITEHLHELARLSLVGFDVERDLWCNTEVSAEALLDTLLQQENDRCTAGQKALLDELHDLRRRCHSLELRDAEDRIAIATLVNDLEKAQRRADAVPELVRINLLLQTFNAQLLR